VSRQGKTTTARSPYETLRLEIHGRS